MCKGKAAEPSIHGHLQRNNGKGFFLIKNKFSHFKIEWRVPDHGQTTLVSLLHYLRAGRTHKPQPHNGAIQVMAQQENGVYLHKGYSIQINNRLQL